MVYIHRNCRYIFDCNLVIHDDIHYKTFEQKYASKIFVYHDRAPIEMLWVMV